MPEEEVDGPRPVIVAHRDSLQLVTSVTLVFSSSFHLLLLLRPKITHGVEFF
jgi:hypothetical protein